MKKNKKSLLDRKVRVVANQALGQKKFCREVPLAAIKAAQIVQLRKAFVVYGD